MLTCDRPVGHGHNGIVVVTVEPDRIRLACSIETKLDCDADPSRRDARLSAPLSY
jgi:hypothetical protein